MIPVKLSLRNFMCYRDRVPPLSFDGIHLACLCGDNGNGKSALLDAMTWALWGKARARTDDELIHLGQSEMEVELEFALNNVHYLILRKRTRARPGRVGQTILELQIATPEGFKSISGNSVPETERKIRQLINMDYPTFINSAYLRQGHADEFTTKPPAQRKQVLANILGLSRYDALEEKARAGARAREQEQKVAAATIAVMEQEIARKDEYQLQLSHTRETLAELNEKVASQETETNALREAKRALDFNRQQLDELRKRTEQSQRELDYWQSQVTTHSRKVKEYEEVLQQRLEVEQGYAQLQATRKLVEELNAKLGQLLGLNERKNALERAIAGAKAELVTQQKLAQRKAEELQAQSQKMEKLRGEWSQAQLKLEKIAQQEEQLLGEKQQAAESARRIQHLKTTNLRLAEEIEELHSKLALLKQGDTACPLCETPLGPLERQRIEQKYIDESKARAESLQGNQAEIIRSEAQYQLREKQARQLELRLRNERTSEQSRALTLEKEIAQAGQAGLELDEQGKRLAGIEEQLAKGDYAGTEQRMLRELGQQTAGLGYDTEQHRQGRQRLTALESYEGRHRKLAEAGQLLPSEKAALDQAKEALAHTTSALEESLERIAILSRELAALPELTRRLENAQAAGGVLLQRQADAQREMGAIQDRLVRCASLEQEREAKRESLAKSAREAEMYEELASAFGKRGIQAFIIESALPEIEEEANRLLGRMTDNRMHVKIETQRETKKRDVVETLEVKISDELGTRSYEMYSGGEAFRIDFALRIALSRLLASRAGAPLATLFIDEGFGTQDSSGLGKLVEAINSIQDDFEKIIVITHLDELKDQFPARIDVIKTAEGSTLSVN